MDNQAPLFELYFVDVTCLVLEFGIITKSLRKIVLLGRPFLFPRDMELVKYPSRFVF